MGKMGAKGYRKGWGYDILNKRFLVRGADERVPFLLAGTGKGVN